jgi:hypothetical protein
MKIECASTDPKEPTPSDLFGKEHKKIKKKPRNTLER